MPAANAATVHRVVEAISAELRQRLASGSILFVIVVADVFVGGWSFSALVALVTVLMSYEWAGLIAKRFGIDQLQGTTTVLTATGAIVAIAFLKFHGVAAAGWALAAASLATAAVALIRGWPVRWLAFGIVYIGLGPVLLIWLRNTTDSGLVFVLFLFGVVWACDVFAYFVGRGVGGPKLAPRYSPGKTWAGFVGGIAAAAAVGTLFAIIFELPFIAGAAALAMLLALAAQVGDLFESSLKRLAGVKDSGNLIPGHGGVLDRLDGLIFATPLFAIFAALHP